MVLSVRKAETRDADMIAMLSLQLGYDTSSEEIKRRLLTISKNKENCVFVGLCDAEVAGWVHAFASLRLESEIFVEIGGLVVDARHRKKGLGALLFEEVRNWAKGIHYSKLRVRSNVIRNESHRFYEGLGFTLIKEQKVFEIKL
jgi:GNAT superfamily N-acetyltransferase